jgi:hypothetical protein
MELSRQYGIIGVGKCQNQKDNADQRRCEEERMALNAFTLNVIMALIGISVPALIYTGCIMTGKKKTTPQPREVAPQFELDRAA